MHDHDRREHAIHYQFDLYADNLFYVGFVDDEHALRGLNDPRDVGHHDDALDHLVRHPDVIAAFHRVHGDRDGHVASAAGDRELRRPDGGGVQPDVRAVVGALARGIYVDREFGDRLAAGDFAAILAARDWTHD